VEEERLRLEELERQRLERLEKIRLAKIEEAKKLEQQRKLEEERKKKEQQQLQVSRGQKEFSHNDGGNWMTFEATYYGSNCYKCSGIGASGVDLRNGIYYGNYRIIATDPKVIPLWTIVEIITPTEKFKAISLDTGGKIKSRKIDVLVQSEEVSKSYGIHNVQLRIIGKLK